MKDLRIDSKIDSRLLFLARLALCLVWVFNGLWLKVILLDAHHLEIMRSVCQSAGQGDPATLLRIIGSLETLLGVGILSGLYYRFVNYFQIFILLLMNVLGCTLGGGTIAHPFGLVISNLPTIVCSLIIASCGPGAWALGQQKSINKQND